MIQEVFPLLLLPIPRITLLELLVVYRTIYLINFFKLLSHHYIYWRPGYTLFKSQQTYKIDISNVVSNIT